MMIQDENRYLLVDSEIERVPSRVGIYQIWQGDRCVYVDEGDLRIRVQTAKGFFPAATHFSLVLNSDGNNRFRIVEQLRVAHGLTQAKRPIGFSRSA
jgi:hypothetical protein